MARSKQGWSKPRKIGTLDFRVKKQPSTNLRRSYWHAQVNVGGQWFHSLTPDDRLLTRDTRKELWAYLEYAHTGKEPK